jgi:hypothetical protein
MKTLEEMTEPELRKLMNTLGSAIEITVEHLNIEKPLFCLILFNDPQVWQYISNCDRSDMIKALKETVTRLERNSNDLVH